MSLKLKKDIEKKTGSKIKIVAISTKLRIKKDDSKLIKIFFTQDPLKIFQKENVDIFFNYNWTI